MDLGRPVCEWLILQQHPEYRDTEAPDPKSMLKRHNGDGARAPSPRRAITMCLSVCVTQCLPFAARVFFFIQKHLMGNVIQQLQAEGAATRTDPSLWWWDCASLMSRATVRHVPKNASYNRRKGDGQNRPHYSCHRRQKRPEIEILKGQFVKIRKRHVLGVTGAPCLADNLLMVSSVDYPE